MPDDHFNREFESALAKYAAVEPRRGLEQRILANLRVEPEPTVARNWRRWPVVVAGAVVAILATIALWHDAKTTGVTRGPVVTSRQDTASAPAAAPGTVEGKSNLKSQMPKLKERQGLRTYALRERKPVNDAPKLEQFPAPEPLSEQEKSLVRFVQEDPDDAALVAEARTEQLQHQREDMKAMGFELDSERQER